MRSILRGSKFLMSGGFQAETREYCKENSLVWKWIALDDPKFLPTLRFCDDDDGGDDNGSNDNI